MLGRLLPNFLADKFGPYNMLLPCLYITASLTFAWFAISNFVGVVVFGLLYGFWSASCELNSSINYLPIFNTCLLRRFFDAFAVGSVECFSR